MNETIVWDNIDWLQITEHVNRLQSRIAKAVISSDNNGRFNNLF